MIAVQGNHKRYFDGSNGCVQGVSGTGTWGLIAPAPSTPRTQPLVPSNYTKGCGGPGDSTTGLS